MPAVRSLRSLGLATHWYRAVLVLNCAIRGEGSYSLKRTMCYCYLLSAHVDSNDLAELAYKGDDIFVVEVGNARYLNVVLSRVPLHGFIWTKNKQALM